MRGSGCWIDPLVRFACNHASCGQRRGVGVKFGAARFSCSFWRCFKFWLFAGCSRSLRRPDGRLLAWPCHSPESYLPACPASRQERFGLEKTSGGLSFYSSTSWELLSSNCCNTPGRRIVFWTLFIGGLWVVICIFWIQRHLFGSKTGTPKSIQSTESFL
jgi:hypothetical protein